MKLTKWYPGDVKPVHVGVYQAHNPLAGDVEYKLWDGEYWSWGEESIQQAERHYAVHYVGSAQDWKWRGIAK